MNCLVVDDDREIAGFVQTALAGMSSSIDVESNGRMAMEKIIHNTYDFIIMDLMLPELNGYNIVKEIRQREIQTPVLILSALQNLEDRVRGLSEGGDDYLTKPFSQAELRIRVEKLWRRAQQQNDVTKLSFQDLHLNRLNREVTRFGKEIDLQKKEFNLLDIFMSNPNKIISKSTILREIWGYEFDPRTNIVDVLVCRLREKIEREDAARLIHTVRGVGYILKLNKTLN